ncbi:MAG: F0F1 ATP synthase subunit A [Flavisolibacter sp.]|nr:F0F1 ATP synthase subunit A [Flavisolibacter sp.]
MRMRVKCLWVAVFSIFCLFAAAQEKEPGHGHIENESKQNMDQENKKTFDANEVIFGHVLDAHQFHFLSYKGSDGKEHHATIPLPVILYAPQKGFSIFNASKFHHGEEAYNGYRLVTQEYKEALAHKGYPIEDLKGLRNESIIAVDENGMPDRNIKVLDFSITRNVVQMILALIVLVWVLMAVAKRYSKGEGVHTAPRGFQNALEPVITFIRDDVARPNLGHKYRKYMPYLLTVFFFILINNIFGLIPGSANVSGNIAFTLVLGVISFIVILVSTNSHYWGHIFNPPVPGGVKPIMIPVEILGIFTKPIALIVRLFANMIAGHIIIICLISLIFIFGGLSTVAGWSFSPISIAFTVFIYFIEILVAFLQAYIFTSLTAVFIGQAFEGSHDDVDHHEDPVIV